MSKLPCNSGPSRTRPHSESQFVELQAKVLRWSINDITASNLFAKKVRYIPKEFSSMKEYLQVFRAPLLEEVRAQLHQALDKSISMQRSDHVVKVTIQKVVKPKKGPGEVQSDKKIITFHLPTNLGVKTSDLLLFCSAKPRWDAERECLVTSNTMFVLACASSVKEDSPVVSAIVYVPDGSPILTKLEVSSVWHVVLPGVGLTPAGRIWNAISVPFASEKELQKSVTHTILRIHPQVRPTEVIHSQTREGAKTLQCVEDYSNHRGLNDSQRDVLKSVLAALLPEDAKPHVRLVQGPPGTGKTTMLASLISVLGCLRRRTLVSAPTNAAVVEISKRMMRFFDDDSMDEVDYYEFCSKTQAGSKRCFPILLSDVVLIGSKEKLQDAVDGTTLEWIFLRSRIDRLQEALCSSTGWKASVQSVMNFLTMAPELFESEDAEAQEYDEGSSNSGATGKKNRSSDKEKKKKKRLARNASFWSFARAFMVQLQDRMEETSVVLTDELPQCYMDMTTSYAIRNATDLMVDIVDLMPVEPPLDATTWFSTTTTTDKLHDTFGNLTLSNGSSTDGKTAFLQAREALLKSLQLGPGCSLFTTDNVPTSAQLEIECLKNATLVFCTVSGAGSPKMKGENFECAIIDEASQLVEAEATIVTRMKGLKQLILVGDHKQLPATVISKVAEKCGYRRSLFDRLQMLQHGCRHMLNTQYRMKPTISSFPNSQFYEGKVKDGPNVLSPTYGYDLHDAAAFGEYAFLDCRHGAEVAHQKSWKNPEEVEVVTTLVTALGKGTDAE
ncbi:hypothetical protein M758_12G111700 [Ceratodon purpureus]|nr:hypothetical protein M758_12G111700 [Ceratodon purpureus]